MKKDDKSLGKIISIIKRINPQEVYLFGSHANGSFDEQSDIDLLIIAPSIDRPSERRMKLRKELSEFDRSIGLDLLVYTPDVQLLRKRSVHEGETAFAPFDLSP